MRSVIVGNGIIALTTAFRLAQRASADDSIVIIGDHQRTGSATLAAGAMLNSFAELERDTLQSELPFYRFELCHIATRMWPKFEEELITAAGASLPVGCLACQGVRGGGCYEHGTYVVSNNSQPFSDDENFSAIVDGLRQFDEPFSLISPDAVPNYLPAAGFMAERALYIPNEGWLNPRLVVEKLDAIMHKHPQIELIDGRAQRLLKSSGRITGVEIANGTTIKGDVYVLANGASAGDIIDRSELGISLQRIFYGVGVSIEIISRETRHVNCVRTPNRAATCAIYSVPYYWGGGQNKSQNHILIGATNFISATPVYHARLDNVSMLMRSSIEQINRDFHHAELARVNLGWRPTSQDTYPMVGKTSIENLIVASATKRDGFHMSPLLSHYIAAMVHDEEIDERFAVFAPERKILRTLTREAAIAKAMLIWQRRRHIANQAANDTAFEVLNDADMAISNAKDALERLHDSIGAIDWGIPPEMIDVYRNGIHSMT